MTAINNTASPLAVAAAGIITAYDAKLAKAEGSLAAALLKEVKALAKEAGPIAEARWVAEFAQPVSAALSECKAISAAPQFLAHYKVALIGISNGINPPADVKSIRTYYDKCKGKVQAKGFIAATGKGRKPAGATAAGNPSPVNPSQGVAASTQDAKAAAVAKAAGAANPAKTYNREVFVPQLATLARLSDDRANRAAMVIAKYPAQFAKWIDARWAEMQEPDAARRAIAPAAPKVRKPRARKA